MRRWLLAVIGSVGVVLMGGASPARAEAPHPDSAPPTCKAGPLPAGATAAQADLNADPDNTKARIAVADALLDQGCYSEAITLLEAGSARHPRGSELQSKLRDARSLMSEQKYFEGLGQAQENARQQRNLLRCRQLADIAACDDALKAKPDDVTLLLAKSDALLRANRAGEAVTLSQHAVQVSPSAETQAKLASAEAQRQNFVARCQTQVGQPGVEACEAALLRGAPDEFSVDTRMGMLLQGGARPGPALEAYIAAQTLQQADKGVALAIVALTDSTGRRDALALQAKGSALLTLGRSVEAVTALRAAQSLAPSLPGIKTLIAGAEAKARADARKVAQTLKHQSPAPAPLRVAAAPPRMYSNAAQPGQAH